MADRVLHPAVERRADGSVPVPVQAAGESDTLTVLAMALGERIDLRRLGGVRLGPGQVLVQIGESARAIVFRYGCAVLFDATVDQQRSFIERIGDLVHEPISPPDTELAEFRVGESGIERTGEGEVIVLDRSAESLEIVADVLAKSAVLAHYESTIAGAFDRAEPLAVELQRRGRAGRRHGAFVRDVATALLAQQRMVGRIEVTEKPDLLWDRPDLERFHAHLVDEYELKERALALERKLSVVSKTAEVVLNLLYDRRSLRVEWYIVILIVVEILITIWDLTIRVK